jgi:hypothetical protein
MKNPIDAIYYSLEAGIGLIGLLATGLFAQVVTGSIFVTVFLAKTWADGWLEYAKAYRIE